MMNNEFIMRGFSNAGWKPAPQEFAKLH